MAGNRTLEAADRRELIAATRSRSAACGRDRLRLRQDARTEFSVEVWTCNGGSNQSWSRS